MNPAVASLLNHHLAAVITSGAVLAWIGAALGIYGPWVAVNTEFMTLRPMTQSMRLAFLSIGELILLTACAILIAAYRVNPVRVTQVLVEAGRNPATGIMAYLTMLELLAIIPIGILGVGWIFAFPSRLSYLTTEGYALTAHTNRWHGLTCGEKFVYPELSCRTSWRARRLWTYYAVR